MDEIVHGMDEFKGKLEQLELTVRRQLLIDAAKAGAKILLEEARRRAPTDTGALAAGMTLRVSGGESDIYEATVDVGPSKKTWYGFMQEFGTKHHAAQPFLGPALEASRDQIISAMKDKLLSAIQKVAG